MVTRIVAITENINNAQTAIDEFRKKAVKSGRMSEVEVDNDDETLLRNLKLFDGKYLTRAAILMFHPEPELFATGAYNIQFFRKRESLSQEELAEKCSVSRQAVTKWEVGESTPSIEKLITLVEIYDVFLIASEEMQGEDRAKYGAEIIKKLAKELSAEYGKGFTKTNLYNFYLFYKNYPEIFHSASGKSAILLSWTHYRILLQVKDKEARDWYEKEAAEQTWSVRTLQRNISSQYYYRMLKTQKKELVENEMKELTASYQNDKLEFIKNPVVAEFLGFSQDTNFTESDLEKSILSNLQKFLMELGKGYAFVARQQHIHTEKITHQDVGQMDMYIRMYDELKRSEGDNPTIGIVLCADTDDDIARYSVMHGNEQLFASKYKLYLPTEEELKAEIETQKAMFYLQQQENQNQETE